MDSIFVGLSRMPFYPDGAEPDNTIATAGSYRAVQISSGSTTQSSANSLYLDVTAGLRLV